MIEVKVRTAELTLTTAKLTQKVLKQLPNLTFQEFKACVTMPSKDNPNPENPAVVGWLHGSLFENKSYPRLLLKTVNGYGLYEAMEDTIARLKAVQIFVV